MKLTQEHKNILKSWGYPEEDFAQIEEATKKTDYTLYSENSIYHKKIGIKEAINLLGIKDFLSGLSRSAFHWSSSRQVGNKDLYVSFDSHRLFRS